MDSNFIIGVSRAGNPSWVASTRFVSCRFMELSSLNLTNNSFQVSPFPQWCLSCFDAVVDVTKFSAKPDGESNSAMAFIQACNAACKSSTGPSNLVIPPGRFMVGKTIFKGPYSSNPVTVEIQETILANSNMSEFGGRACLLFQDVDGLTVLGGGIFDGQVLYQSSIKVQKVTNAVIWDINLVNSKGFHMTITSCSNFVVERLNITASENSLNPDEKHISCSDQVHITMNDVQNLIIIDQRNRSKDSIGEQKRR
ncbi:unnamed protein product [Camellia sinensis]